MVDVPSIQSEDDMMDIRKNGKLFAKETKDKRTLKISRKGITVTFKVINGRIEQTE